MRRNSPWIESGGRARALCLCVMFWNTSIYSRTARDLRPCLRPSLSTRFVIGVPRHSVLSPARFLSEKCHDKIPTFRELIAKTSEGKRFSDHTKGPPIRNQVLVRVQFLVLIFAFWQIYFAVLPRRFNHSIHVCRGENKQGDQVLVRKDDINVNSMVFSITYQWGNDAYADDWTCQGAFVMCSSWT